MKWLTALCIGLLITPAWSGELENELSGIQQRWAEIQYQLPENERADAFAELSETAADFVTRFPQQAEPLIWQGIILSTYAGAKGGLGALKLVKQARDALEQALAIAPEALDGSAYTSLGSLYYQVPGWPLGFGDDDQAEAYLRKALALNPNGIDANYFYGDFLLRQGNPEEARQYLNLALTAPARPGRALADQGRRQEIQEKLAALARQGN